MVISGPEKKKLIMHMTNGTYRYGILTRRGERMGDEEKSRRIVVQTEDGYS